MKIITNNEKINFIVIRSKTFTFLIAFTFLFFFFSFGSHIIVIPSSHADLDSFSAKGTISISFGDSNIQLPSLSSTSNIALANTTTASTIDTIKGQWSLKVNKGNPQIFDIILVSYNKNDVPQNAYGIFNLRDVNFIQLNNQGSEIINGKVDFRSIGQVNETIRGIDATLIIEKLHNIQIILSNDTDVSNNYYYHIFNKPVVGKTVLMADGSDKLLVDKRQQKISIAPIPSTINPPNKYQDSVPIPTPFSYDSSNNIPRSLPNNAPPASPSSSTMPPATNSPNTIR